MRRGIWFAAVAWLCLNSPAWGDDDSAADGGSDSGKDEAGKGGKGGAGAGGKGAAGNGGAGGKGGAGGSSGAGATQDVTIRFKAKIGEDDLECGKSYANQGTSNVSASVQDFRFFVEEVRLVTKDGIEAKVQFDDRSPFQTKDVALIDFTDNQGTCTAGGAKINTTITGKVVPGTYTKVVFATGVPETVNHQSLTEAKPPLQDASAYWGWQSGYRFVMTGLIVDAADRPAPEPPDEDGGVPKVSNGANFVHIGAGGCTATSTTGFMCTRANRTKIVLDDFDVGSSTIVADLHEVYEDVDLKDSIECHGPAPECEPVYTAFGLSLATGNALDSQKVFRLE